MPLHYATYPVECLQHEMLQPFIFQQWTSREMLETNCTLLTTTFCRQYHIIQYKHQLLQWSCKDTNDYDKLTRDCLRHWYNSNIQKHSRLQLQSHHKTPISYRRPDSTGRIEASS